MKKPAPNAVFGGKTNEPKHETIMTPKPIDKGPAIFKNFSEGAHTAVSERPEMFNIY